MERQLTTTCITVRWSKHNTWWKQGCSCTAWSTWFDVVFAAKNSLGKCKRFRDVPRRAAASVHEFTEARLWAELSFSPDAKRGSR